MPNDQINSIGQAIARDSNATVANRAAPVPAEATGGAATSHPGTTAPVADPALVKRAAEQINEFIKSSSHNLQFSVDKDSGRIIVKVVDQETGALIRQIPSEETIAIASSLDKPQGVIIRSKA